MPSFIISCMGIMLLRFVSLLGIGLESTCLLVTSACAHFGVGTGRWFAKGQFCKQMCTVRSGDLKLERYAWEASE